MHGYRIPLADLGFRSPICNDLFIMMESNRNWLLYHQASVPEDQLWARPIPHKNSVGNLLWHVAQAERDWVCHWICGLPNDRDRDSEFSPDLRMSRQQLLDHLASVRAQSRKLLSQLSDEDLDRPVSRPGFNYTVKRAILHLIQHEAYHVGQIVYIREALK